MHKSLDKRIATDLKPAIINISTDVEAKIDAAIKATTSQTFTLAQNSLLATNETLVQQIITEGTHSIDQLTGETS